MNSSREVDNRCLDDVIVYYEARIEALANRVRELELQIRAIHGHNAHLGAVRDVHSGVYLKMKSEGRL